MRKPDGLTAEDALRGRPSLSGLLSPGDTPTQSYPHFPAMRRKSVLPKQSSLSTLPIEDDDDEDEVDDSPALLADTEVPLVITHAEEDDAADYLASGDHARTPTPTPRELPLPTGRASLNVPTPKGATPMGSKLPPTRVSPLKGGAALNPPPARKNGTALWCHSTAGERQASSFKGDDAISLGSGRQSRCSSESTCGKWSGRSSEDQASW